MSIKINRIESMLVKEISYVLANEVKDNDIKFVTVTAVKVTNDLSFAKVYVMVLDMNKKDTTMKALNDAAGFIRSELFDRVDIRHIPELTFVYDELVKATELASKVTLDNMKKNEHAKKLVADEK